MCAIFLALIELDCHSRERQTQCRGALRRKILSPHCKRDIKNKENLVIRTFRKESFERLNYTVYILPAISVSTESAIGVPHSGDKGKLVTSGSRYASFGYLSAMQRTGSAFCGYWMAESI